MSTYVSIIIPTLNNEDTIRTCLNSIDQQDAECRIEVIIADGGSSDLTTEIAAEKGATVIEQVGKISEARVRGAIRSRGDYVFHLDSDMELESSVVSTAVAYCEENQADAVVIPEINIGGTYWAGVTDVEKELFRKAETGNARFIGRDVYFKYGPHNNKLTAKEDEYLHAKLVAGGCTIGFIHGSHIRHHVGDVTLGDILSHRRRYSETLDEYENLEIEFSHRPDLIPQVPNTLLNNLRYIPGFVLLRMLILLQRLSR